MMNATGLPIPAVSAAATPPAAESVATPTESAQDTPKDFVLALAQMIGASVPANASARPTVPASADDTEAQDAQAAALALLPLPIGQTQPEPVRAENVDPLELLGIAGRDERAAARHAAILQALTDRLAGVEAKTQDIEASVGAMPSLEAMQQRLAVSEVAAHSRPLQQPVGTRAWADELGARLTMMTEKGQHTASLRLSPEHLGPLEIRIAMRDDQASVWFGAAHADTRAAIEHALPRLRELFAAQGMSLADAGVFREPPKQAFAEWRSSGHNGVEAAALVDDEPAPARVQLGLLDAYA
jgi:flagellar hook-length control protein FliK